MTRIAVIAATVLAAAFLIYWRGGVDQRAIDADAYGHTRGVIDDAVSGDLSDDLVLERLRRHAKP